MVTMGRVRAILAAISLAGFMAAISIHIPAYFGVIIVPQRSVHILLVIGIFPLGYVLQRLGLLQFPSRLNIEPHWVGICTSVLFVLGVLYFVASLFVDLPPGERGHYNYSKIAPLIHLTANQYDHLRL